MEQSFVVAILAAGQGTRFKSKRAKVLHSAGGRTLIEHAVRAAQALDPKQTFVIVGYQAEQVMESLRNLKISDLCFIHQTEQLGTGHALLCGRKELESAAPRMLVFYGDTPLLTTATLQKFLRSHLNSGAAASVLTAQVADPTGYGRIIRQANSRRDSDGSLAAIVEQKSASAEQLRITEVNTGIYCFETKALFAALEQVKPDPKKKEYYLTDVIGVLHQEGKKVQAYLAGDSREVMGINTRVELAQADAMLRERKAQELMLAGVTIIRPETVLIDPDVEVGADTVIEPGVTLRGRTRIGEDCRIGSFSVIVDSELSNHVTVEPSCMIAQARIGRHASIGPFARLRPGAEIGEEARVGNFVEVKQTRLGRASKAQHLTYLGDAIIGDNVNIGAGTITCNYDGEKKNQTVIEDNVFIGSGTELVAPVRVGRNSYVAAGSTVTEDVPPNSLTIARSRQSTKPGWVQGRKKKREQNKASSGPAD
ncbi:MAG: UDP-N-acetylglucosamine diphosphorylase/glucosamine-1-phosphate N-acetyltransferase [Acidobacteria bacterium RIFCSPLOWO2_02_FULL_59_13]|nr:MAG: UDP-N-acetylglucosamine diphosphorylase/glucosamine-1-phosphate N-acetyltransferase [Acidobacteria bacterium RIFCSPLOWO2_02_FULL_59_13]